MRVYLTLAGCMAVLLLGVGLLFVSHEVRHSQAPPDATSVRIYRHGLSEVHVSYRVPASWTLLDLYQYHAAQGWIRDGATERSLQYPWTDSPTTVFAVFTRQRLFGLVSEIASIGMPADTRAEVLVRQIRCVKIEPWIRCL